MIKMNLLKPEDIDGILELENLCFPEDPWSRLSFENELENPISVFLIAKEEETGRLVGYGGVWMMYDVGNITNIAVHPDYRREGIGREILKLLVQVCREKEMSSVTLEVRKGNLPAIGLYEAENFQVCGLRRRYYRDFEDALIMTKEL